MVLYCILIITMALISGATWWYTRMYLVQSKSESALATPAECRMIISCKGFGTPFTLNHLPALKCRATPNQRLVHTFGVNNAFTTTDDKRYREFRNEAVHKLNLTNNKWLCLAVEAQTIIKDSLTNSRIPLMPYVQNLTLRIVLSIMFDADALTLSPTAIDVVTASINDLWTRSKLVSVANSAAADAFHSQQRFRAALHDLLPDHHLDDPTSNPLNLILPAYETLWRIVLLGFVEIRFRTQHGDTQKDSITALRAFLASPAGLDNSSRKDAESDGTRRSITAFDIARELLRLYPSTKRVYRVFDSSPTLTSPVPVAADVEAIHRCVSVWGAAAGVFDPGRWVPSVAVVHMEKVDMEKQKEKEKERGDAYMPFGVYPFLCPARKDFGRRIIALLVASLVVGVRAEGAEMGVGAEMGKEEEEEEPAEGKEEELSVGEDEEEEENTWRLAVPERWWDVVSKGEEPLPSERGSFEGWALLRT